MDLSLGGGASGLYTGLPDLPGGIDKDDLENGPRDQLLVCGDCHTIEHVPAFEGPMEYNEPLQARLRNHLVALADGLSTHAIAFTTVNAKLWAESEDFRKYITKAISDAQKTGDVGLGNEMYDLKSTFQEDAMTCWRVEHNRTQNCEDYKSDKKRLLPDTRGDRKELGLEVRSKHRPTTAYLCQYCPYHSIVMERVRKEQGFY